MTQWKGAGRQYTTVQTEVEDLPYTDDAMEWGTWEQLPC